MLLDDITRDTLTGDLRESLRFELAKRMAAEALGISLPSASPEQHLQYDISVAAHDFCSAEETSDTFQLLAFCFKRLDTKAYPLAHR